MAVIQITTPDISENIKTFTSEDYTGGTTLSVESATSFANGNYIVVGEPGNEKTEATYLTAIPGASSMTIAALNYDHPKGTPVYFTRWDKYELDYNTGAGWVTYGSMPTDLRWDALQTEYRDSASTSSYSWRYRYYSTEKTAYSDYSSTITSTGWTDNSVGYMIRNVRKIILDPDGQTIKDAEIIRYFNAAQDKIFALYDRWWFLLKVGTAIDTVASRRYYALPSDFGRMHSVMFNYVSGDTDVTYQLKYISFAEYDYMARDNDAADDDNVKRYTLYPADSNSTKGYIYVWPAPATAGLHITPRYYKEFTALDGYGDTTEVPIPAMLEDYALAQVFKIRAVEDKASYYDKIFREQIDLLKLMQRKQVGPPRSLWVYRGRKAMDRYYGNSTGSATSDDDF